ncbi:OmpA-like domain-containing protein [Vibrio chagasii]|nr:OmpA-like domain-containing protein [Vibrio chagasii]
MKKTAIAAIVPLILAGCVTTGNESASTGYYEEVNTDITFESLDDIFEAHESEMAPTEESASDAFEELMTEGGYTKLELEELEDKGIDLDIISDNIIGFDFDSYAINAQFEELIKSHASLLIELPTLKVILEGHTDALGDRAYNLKLGENRAIAVKEVLVNQYGIEADRVEVISFGKEKLLSKESTDAANQANRRAVFKYL